MSHKPLAGVIRRLHHLLGAPGAALSDRQLLEQYGRDHDEEAFASLVRRHGALVMGICRRILRNHADVEDVFQATFLVLARKASALAWHDSVGNWLYGVAYRLSCKAKGEVLRREDRERRAAALREPEPRPEADLRELAAVLDEEMQRLPAKCRAVLVACYLEGMTRDEAARHLGWPLRTLDRRLKRGRELLRDRLTGRGVTLSAALLTAGLGDSGLSAAVPVGVLTGVARMAVAHAQAPGLTASVPARAIGLAEELTRGLAAAKLKVFAVLFMAVTLVVGAGTVAYRGWSKAAEPAPAPSAIASLGQPAQRKAEPRAIMDEHGDPLPSGAIARLGTTRFRQEGQVDGLAYSPDGKILASSGDGRVHLWDAASGKELRWMRNQEVTGISFSPHGTHIAGEGNSFDGDTSRMGFIVWETNTGRQIRKVLLPGSILPCQAGGATFSPDGKGLLVNNNGVYLVALDTGKPVWRLDKNNGAVFSGIYSPDGKTLAIGTRKSTVQIVDAATGRSLREIIHGKEWIRSLAYSRDGRTLASGSTDAILLSDPSSGRELTWLKAPGMGTVNGLAFTLDGKTLISASYDGKIRFWNVPGREQRLLLDTGLEYCMSLALSADGKRLAVGGGAHSIAQWDVTSGRRLSTTLDGHQRDVTSVAFGSGGKLLVSGDGRRDVHLWNAATGTHMRTIGGHRGDITILLPGGRCFLSAASPWPPSLVHLSDTTTGKEVAKFKLDGAENLWGLAISTDGRTIVAAAEKIVPNSNGWGTGSLQVWSLLGDRPRHRFALPSLVPVLLTPDIREGKVAWMDPKGTIHFWNISKGRELFALTPEESDIPAAMALSQDGNVLITGSRGSTICLWEIPTGQLICRLRGHQHAVAALALSPDGRIIASGDGLRYYPAADGGFRGHPRTSKPNRICFWDTVTGKKLGEYQGHGTYALSLAFSPDGTRLASGLLNTTVLFWDTKPILKSLHGPRLVLSDNDLSSLWADLAGKDSSKAYEAIGKLLAAPERSLAYLKIHLKPAPKFESAEAIRKLLADMDSATFTIRQKAYDELAKLNEQIEPFLRQELEKSPTLERRRRLEKLLEDTRFVRSPESLRRVRAIQVLDRVGTPGATEILQILVAGEPRARETQDARAALQRLEARKHHLRPDPE